MMRMRLGMLLTAALLAAPPSRAAEPPFELNAVIPQTGVYAFQGHDALQALSLIEAMTNRSGGINGRPIKFVVTDDQSNPANAVQAANAIIAKHASVILGSVAVSTCSAIAPLVKNGPLMYCFSPGIHPEKGSYVFSGGVSTVDTLGASKVFFQSRGWRKVAFITSTDATGQDADRIIDGIFGDPASGLEIVAHEHFNPGDLGVGAQMAKIKSSGAQVLVAWTTGTSFGTVLRNATEAGLNLPVLTTAGNLSDAQMRAFATFLPKELYIPGTPAFAPDRIPRGPLKRALQGYFDALKSVGAKPENGTSLAWDGTLVVIDALRKLGVDATPTQLRDYIANLRTGVGIYGQHDYVAVPQRGVGVGSVVMIRWDAAREGWVGVSGLGGATPK
jgi:branched-chain amino acid transport system substrate-binding protein